MSLSAAAVALLAGAAAQACYTGLLVIPTAQTVGESQYSAEYQTDGLIRRLNADTRFVNHEFGIGNRLEIGANVDVNADSDTRVLSNAKVTAIESGSGRFAAAIGVCNAARGVKAAPYVVTTTRVGQAHIHLGAMRIGDDARCIAGIDRQSGKLTLMGDYTSGQDGLSSLGLNYQITDSLAVMAGGLFPRGGGDTGFTVHIVFCRPIGGARS